MAPKAIVAAVAVAMISAVAHSQSKRLSRRRQASGSKRQQRGQQRTEPITDELQLASAHSGPEALMNKQFGDEKRVCVVVEAVADSRADNSRVADKETFKALKQLLALVLSVFSCICFLSVAVATGSFASLAAAPVVAYTITTPAAVGVRRYYGRALNEALDESIKTTGVPWDLAVI